jgi:hypothetical protein|tara:strand:+ start:1191 stop:1340 length:150 start_codon:yes stop_codon:yes gene_type:complete
MRVGRNTQTVAVFEELFPFGGQLEEDNCWLRIAELIPWTGPAQKKETMS